VLAASPAHAVVRTAWLFGVGGRNFVATMLGLAAGGTREVSVVEDQIGSPTFAGHLARGLVGVLEAAPAGIIHLAGSGRCSWFELAQAVFAQRGLEVRVLPTTSAEFARPAPRPSWSVLGSERHEIAPLAPWEEGLRDYLATTEAAGAR
jgi:dTDP-4-dehydrorhamnose reductase